MAPHFFMHFEPGWWADHAGSEHKSAERAALRAEPAVYRFICANSRPIARARPRLARAGATHGVLPTASLGFALGLGHARYERVGRPGHARSLGRRREKAHAETREHGRASRSRLELGGALDHEVGNIRLELHEEAVGRGAPVNAHTGHGAAEIVRHRAYQIVDLEGDRLERR